MSRKQPFSSLQRDHCNAKVTSCHFHAVSPPTPSCHLWNKPQVFSGASRPSSRLPPPQSPAPPALALSAPAACRSVAASLLTLGAPTRSGCVLQDFHVLGPPSPAISWKTSSGLSIFNRDVTACRKLSLRPQIWVSCPSSGPEIPLSCHDHTALLMLVFLT